MAIRTPEEQSEHDNVLRASYSSWNNRSDVKVYENPDGQKNCVVGQELYPDIVVMDLNGNLYAIEEVETESTVTLQESEQWKQYAKFGVPFNLIIPAVKQLDAQKLIAGIQNIRIRTYTMTYGEAQITV
jgi:hypothetical protein